METFSNKHATLSLYKSSLKGSVHDYMLSFYDRETAIESIIGKTLALFQQLYDKYKPMRARLIARINYLHINDKQDVVDNRSYYFPSYQAEVVTDIEDFITRHLMKIVSRIDQFTANGSNLLLNRIEHIHMSLTVL